MSLSHLRVAFFCAQKLTASHQNTELYFLNGDLSSQNTYSGTLKKPIPPSSGQNL
jgi:hypothetical protein